MAKKTVLPKSLTDLGVFSLSDSIGDVEFISTGSIILDYLIGGGFPIGRVTEIFGDFSTGKSLVASQTTVIAQENGFIVLYIDTESALSIEMMKSLGVDVDKLLYATPETIEEVFTIMETTIDYVHKQHDGKKTLVIMWDTIAATSTMNEIKNPYGKAMYAEHARLISAGMRKITKKIADRRVVAVFLNQVRQNIGIMYGDKETTFGGKAVSFYASVRVRLQSGSKIQIGPKNKRQTIGRMTNAEVVKNKVDKPFRKAKLPIYFGFGIDEPESVLEFLKDLEVINHTGGGNYELTDDELKDIGEFTKTSWPDLYEEHINKIEDFIFSLE